MSHDFSDAELWSQRFDSAERAAWQKPEEVVAAMAIESGMTVVDLGAGTGYFSGFLATAVGAAGTVLALDPEAGMVSFLEERARREGWTGESLGRVEARQIPYDDPQLAAGSVDRILIVNTWHHISHRSDYSRKLRQALAPGGRLFVVDYTLDSPQGPPVKHRLPPEEVAAELRRGGFEPQVLEEDLPRQYIVAAVPAS